MTILLLFRPRGTAPAGPADFPATGALAAQSATLSGTATLSRTSSGALQADSATMSGTATNSGAPVVQPATMSGRGFKYRIIEDPDKVFEEIKKEERAIAKERKKLVILEKKKPASPQGIYRVEQQIQAVEARIDDRMARIADLMLMIQDGVDAIADDDEDVLLLS